jgi:hypothetical protein
VVASEEFARREAAGRIGSIYAARGRRAISERSRSMSDHKPDPVKPASLTDEEIVTERKLPRRAFLSTTGVLLAGGAAAVVAGAKGVAHDFMPQGDPDKKPADPDKPRATDPDKPRATDPDSRRAADPDKAKATDPDKARATDPDKARATDPDKPRAADPDKTPPPAAPNPPR